MFTDDFQLYYPSNPLTAAELFGEADYPNPTVMAEFFGDHILVNGQAWPVLDVEPRLYRLRFLNGCDTRFLNMGFAGLKFYVIGTDQGLLNAPVKVNRISIAPGERIDVLVDFSGQSNKTFILGNNAPGTFRRPLVVDPQTTGRIMAFRVGIDSNGQCKQRHSDLTLRGGTGQPPKLPAKPHLTYPLSPGPGPAAAASTISAKSCSMRKRMSGTGCSRSSARWRQPWLLVSTNHRKHHLRRYGSLGDLQHHRRCSPDPFASG